MWVRRAVKRGRRGNLGGQTRFEVIPVEVSSPAGAGGRKDDALPVRRKAGVGIDFAGHGAGDGLEFGSLEFEQVYFGVRIAATLAREPVVGSASWPPCKASVSVFNFLSNTLISFSFRL